MDDFFGGKAPTWRSSFKRLRSVRGNSAWAVEVVMAFLVHKT